MSEKVYDVERITTVDSSSPQNSSDMKSIKKQISRMEENVDDVGYKRQITGRQVLMITFGAGIGNGFWIGTGTSLKHGGPFGIVFAYFIISSLVGVMYIHIGEMTAFQPIQGGFIRQEMMYLDKAWAFAQGLIFSFDWMICLTSEITAAISLCRYWDTEHLISPAEYILMSTCIYILGNMWPVKAYGHIEYVMSFVKLFAMVGTTIFMLVGTCGGLPNMGPIGFKYWKHPGWLNNGFKGIVSSLAQAASAFGGGEHIAVVAGEVKHPRKFIPRCTQPIFWRMFVLFVGNSWLITMNVPFNDITLNNASGTLSSPFIITMVNGGVKILPDILNGVILLSVISCGNAAVYIASRCLVGLADKKLIHPVFAKKDKSGRPYIALVVTFVVGVALAFLNCSDTGTTVYDWIVSLVGLNGYVLWITIYLTHYRFRLGLKAQGIDFHKFKIYDKLFPYDTYVAVVSVIILLGFQFYLGLYPLDDTGMTARERCQNFFLTWLYIPLFIVLYSYYKIRHRTKMVPPDEMDFSYAKEWDLIEEQEQATLLNTHSKREKYSALAEKYLA